MCDFISWKYYQNKLYYLNDDKIKERFQEWKQYNPGWYEDIRGHGAIDWFYKLPEGCGIKKECKDFSNPNNFPIEIVNDIKLGKFVNFGIALPILTDEARKKYNKSSQQALDEYLLIEQPLWEKFQKLEQLTWNSYNKLREANMNNYYKTIRTVFWKIANNTKNRVEIWR